MPNISCRWLLWSLQSLCSVIILLDTCCKKNYQFIGNFWTTIIKTLLVMIDLSGFKRLPNVNMQEWVGTEASFYLIKNRLDIRHSFLKNSQRKLYNFLLHTWATLKWHPWCQIRPRSNIRTGELGWTVEWIKKSIQPPKWRLNHNNCSYKP